MSTPTDITDLSTTAASNSPAGSEAPSVLDNEIRALASIIKQEASSGSNIASGGTITPPAAGRFFHVTGTTTITTIASTNSWNGRLIVLEFDGALTLTHHATNLALPGGANITTADGDIAIMVQESSGAWHCVSYLDASSHYIGAATTDTLTNKTIDADNNTISNIVIGAECTGASTALTDTADLTYNADTDVSGNGWVVDEDNMASDLATKVPTQQSVKAYVDTSVAGLSTLTLGTEQAASGTSMTFTGIPSGTKRIIMMIDKISTSSASNLTFRLGDSGGVEATGYSSAGAYVSVSSTCDSAAVTTGFEMNSLTLTTDTASGTAIFTLEDSTNFTWTALIVMSGSSGASFFTAGSKALSGELDRVSLTTASGSPTFDAGAINIQYEG